jgi:glycolate oxidase
MPTNATTAISEIIGGGIIPAALEMMDQGHSGGRRSGISLRLPARRPGNPVDRSRRIGGRASTSRRDRIVELCRRCGAREMRQARDAAERLLLWKSRKQAFGAGGRLSPQLLHARRCSTSDEASLHPAKNYRDWKTPSQCGS